MQTSDPLLWDWQTLLQVIAAAGALGTAAFGLVDVSKVVRAGLPSVGFGALERCFAGFSHTLDNAVGCDDWRAVLRAHWISGSDKAEQKAIVRSLVRLGLSSEAEVVAELAGVARVDPRRLREVAVKLEQGDPLTERDFNVMGRLDATLDALIDAAYERADHAYRNTARAAAAGVSVVLAAVAGWMMFGFDANFWWAVAVGVVAVPLAPIAKDLSSALSAGARVAASVRGGGA